MNYLNWLQEKAEEAKLEREITNLEKGKEVEEDEKEKNLEENENIQHRSNLWDMAVFVVFICSAIIYLLLI